MNAYACHKDNQVEAGNMVYASSWLALTWDRKSFNKLTNVFKWVNPDDRKDKLIRPWTDKYSDLLLIIEPNNLLDQIRYFQPFYW